MSDKLYMGEVTLPLEKSGLLGGVVDRNRLYLEYRQLFEHVFVQGTTGSGKTEFLKNLIYQLIQRGKRVCIVDGAGNPSFARSIVAMASEKGYKVPVVKYSWETPEPSAVFNGFTGDAQAIYNRLIALLALEDYRSMGDHYQREKRNLLSLVCGVNTEWEYPEALPFDPPRSFNEVRDRLRSDWFSEMLDLGEMAKSKAAHLSDLRSQIEERARPLLHILHPNGFSLNDYPVTVFSINQARGGFTAKYLFDFLGECFKDSMGRGEETIWIIDEAGAFESRVVADITKIGRQNGLGLVIALQSISSLGEDRYTDEILDCTNTHVVLRAKNSEELRGRAGQTKEKESRTNYDKDGMPSGQNVSYRYDDRIKHEQVLSLRNGQYFVVMGYAIFKIQPRMVQLKTPYDPSMEVRFTITPDRRRVSPRPNVKDSLLDD